MAGGKLIASLSLFVALLLVGVARAGVSSSLDYSVKVNHQAGDATFTINFHHVPDFLDVDAAHRPADSFLVEIAADPSGPNPLANPTSVVRGDEIQYASALRIRDAFPPVADPQAGGFGAVRGVVPFNVTGNTLSFTAPLKTLGAPDGLFAYEIFTTAHGSLVANATGSTAVPLPTALAAIAITGIPLGLFGAVRKMWRKRMEVRSRSLWAPSDLQLLQI